MSDRDDYKPAFPKPERKEKKRKGLKRSGRLPPVRKKGKRRFNKEQHDKRVRFEKLYRHTVRPRYLLDLARRQGRLKRPDEQIWGDTLREKLESLTRLEAPDCEVRAPGTDCEERAGRATQIHHKRGRGRRKHEPHLLIDTSLFAGACPECHEYIERNRKWSMREGWILSRHDKIDESL